MLDIYSKKKMCINCKSKKTYREFPRKGGIDTNFQKRKPRCYECEFKIKNVLLTDEITGYLKKIGVEIVEEVELVSRRKIKKKTINLKTAEFLKNRYMSYDFFKQLIVTRDREICRYCGEKGDTIDHVRPISRGGKTTFNNCVCACEKCNENKADKQVVRYD